MSAVQTQGPSASAPSLKKESIALARPYVFGMSEVDGKVDAGIKQKLVASREGVEFATMTLNHPYVIVASTFTDEDIIRVEQAATIAPVPTATAVLESIKQSAHIVGVSTAFVLKLMGELFTATPTAAPPVKAILTQLFDMSSETTNIVLNARQMGVIAFIHGIHAEAVAKGQMLVGFTDTIPKRYRAVLKFLKDADGADVVRYQNLWADLSKDFMAVGGETYVLSDLTAKLENPIEFMRKFIEISQANNSGSVNTRSTERTGTGIDYLFEDWMRGLVFNQMFRQNPPA